MPKKIILNGISRQAPAVYNAGKQISKFARQGNLAPVDIPVKHPNLIRID